MTKLTIVITENGSNEPLEVALKMNYELEIITLNLDELDKLFVSNNLTKDIFISCENLYLGLPKLQILREANLRKFNIVNLISPSAIISNGVILGSNLFIGDSCNVKSGCELKDGVFLGNSTSLGANVKIGRCSTLHQEVEILSNVKIGDHVFIGSGAKIISNSIGNYSSLENRKLYKDNFAPMTHDLLGHRGIILPIGV